MSVLAQREMKSTYPTLRPRFSTSAAPFWDNESQLYHLFYQSDSSKWLHTTSPTLLHWSTPSDTSLNAKNVYIHPEKHQLRAITPDIRTFVSTDHGKKWSPSKSIHISGSTSTLEGNVHIGTYPALSHILNSPESSLYAIVTKDNTAFLHTINPSNITEWTYKNPLITLTQPATHWSGDFAAPWKKAEPITLSACPRDPSYTRDVLLVSTSTRCLWASDTLTREERPVGVVDLDYDFSGVLDHGSTFASCSSFVDFKNRRVLLGNIGMPRVLSIAFVPGVIKALKTRLEDLECFGLEDEREDLTGIRTLGINPLPEIKALRKDEEVPILDVVLGGDKMIEDTELSMSRFELEAEIDVRAGCKTVGFMLGATRIWFSPETEELGVSAKGVEEKGGHTLFLLSRQQEEVQELLQLRVFHDGNGTVEVFANGRFALTAAVDPHEASGNIVAFAEGEKECAVFEDVKVWSLE